MNPIIKMNEAKQVRNALLPNLSIPSPRKGLAIAEIIYGTPNRYPAYIVEK